MVPPQLFQRIRAKRQGQAGRASLDAASITAALFLDHSVGGG